MHLDFEKPIVELEQKLQEIKQLAQDNDVDVESTVKALEKKIDTLKRNTYKNLTRWQRVQLSRHPQRPYTLDYIYTLADDFIELHGDRGSADDKAIVGGLGTLDGQTIMFIGHQKGRNTKDRQYRNFGMANPEGYRKALRLMRMAEKFNCPIVTLIDTPGAYPGLHAEEHGQAEAIALNLREMFTIKVPIICVVIGEGASGGALGIGIGDKVMMLENTWYSVISPESCSAILWKSWEYKEQAAEALRLTALDMQDLGLIDEVIPEPLGGAHLDPVWMAHKLKRVLKSNIKQLKSQKPEELINLRIEKFCKMGVYKEELPDDMLEDMPSIEAAAIEVVTTNLKK